MANRDLRPNLQTNQSFEGNAVNDGNGWPVPLCDPSNPLKMVVTNGGNGTQKNFDPVATSRQNDLSLSEGYSANKIGNQLDQGSHANKWQTSQQNASDHSTPETESESD